MSSTPTTPEPTPADRGADRRQGPRRAEDQRVHLAQQLVIEKARSVALSYVSGAGLDIAALEQLVALVEVLETSEKDAREAPPR